MFNRHSQLVLTAAIAVWILISVALQGCKAQGPKNLVHADWSALEALNPTDVAVVPVQKVGLPPELDVLWLREAMRDQLLNHRYSPLAFSFVDSGSPITVRTGIANADGSGGMVSGGRAVRLTLVLKEFETRRYDMSKSIRVVGDFQFSEADTDRLIATVNSDQTIDLEDVARNGGSLNDAIRIASRRFVTNSLAGMPDRAVDGRNK